VAEPRRRTAGVGGRISTGARPAGRPGGRRGTGSKPAPAKNAALLRKLGYIICGVGLAVFYLSTFVPALLGASDALPAAVWRAGAVLAAVGCLWLVVLLIRPATQPARASREAVFGFVSLPAALISLFGIAGETGVVMFWLVVTVFLLPASVALILLAALVERAHTAAGRGR